MDKQETVEYIQNINKKRIKMIVALVICKKCGRELKCEKYSPQYFNKLCIGKCDT